MATADPGGSDPQTWLDIVRVWAPGVTPAALLGGLVGFYKWASARRDGIDAARASRVEAEAKAEAAERQRQDAVDAAQIARLTDEIARKNAEIAANKAEHSQQMAALRTEKDTEIALLKKDRDDGWRGCVAGSDGWRACRHLANDIIGRLALLLDARGVAYERPEKLPSVPDLDTLAGRK